jgi:hypothetical protein
MLYLALMFKVLLKLTSDAQAVVARVLVVPSFLRDDDFDA